MSNDSTHGRAVGTHPGSFSGGEYCRWTSWAQTDSDALCARSGTLDSQHRRAMAHAAAELPELQNCASALSDLVPRCGFAARARGALNEEECFIDATFVMAKGGGLEIGATKRGKGMKIMAIVDRHGLPLSASTQAANHHEVRLVQLCFDFYMIEAKPEKLIGDRAYDSDPLVYVVRAFRTIGLAI